MGLEKKAGYTVGPKIGRQNHQDNDQRGPIFTGGWVHSSSVVTSEEEERSGKAKPFW